METPEPPTLKEMETKALKAEIAKLRQERQVLRSFVSLFLSYPEPEGELPILCWNLHMNATKITLKATFDSNYPEDKEAAE